MLLLKAVIILNKIWHYRGPVYRFEHIHSYIWDAYTTAPTMGKALSNLASRYKKENGLDQSAKIVLDNMFINVEEI